MTSRYANSMRLVVLAIAALTASLVYYPAAAAPPSTTTPASKGEEVVATVNGKPITRAELTRELLIRHGQGVLQDMIRQRAVEQEMRRTGITATGEEVDRELERERQALAADPREKRTLETMVTEKYRMSMEGYRDIVRRWLLIRKLLLRRETPTDDEVMLWFYRNRERYDTPAEHTVRHIFVAWKDPRTGRERSRPEVERRIARVREGLVKDEDFGRLARRYSDDLATRESSGKLGTVNERAARLHLEPAFVEAMVLLKPGQSGGPVETPKGFHFLQVTKRKEGRRADYGEYRTLVRHDYLEERALLLREPFLRELMERAKVTRNFEPPKRRRGADGAPRGATD